MSSLADRLSSALKAKADATPADLARACKVQPPSVSDWLSGESKSMKALPALLAAAFLGVEPMWLVAGTGPRSRSQPGAYPPAAAPIPLRAAQPVVGYRAWPFSLDREEFDKLPLEDRLRVDVYITATADSRNGHTLKKRRKPP